MSGIDDFQTVVQTQFRIPAGLIDQPKEAAYNKVLEEQDEVNEIVIEVFDAIENWSDDKTEANLAEVEALIASLEMEYGDLEVTIAGLFEAIERQTGIRVSMADGRTRAIEKIVNRVSIGGRVNEETGLYEKPEGT